MCKAAEFWKQLAEWGIASLDDDVEAARRHYLNGEGEAGATGEGGSEGGDSGTGMAMMVLPLVGQLVSAMGLERALGVGDDDAHGIDEVDDKTEWLFEQQGGGVSAVKDEGAIGPHGMVAMAPGKEATATFTADAGSLGIHAMETKDKRCPYLLEFEHFVGTNGAAERRMDGRLLPGMVLKAVNAVDVRDVPYTTVLAKLKTRPCTLIFCSWEAPISRPMFDLSTLDLNHLPRQKQQALYLFARAAEQGHVLAQANAAWMLHHGHGGHIIPSPPFLFATSEDKAADQWLSTEGGCDDGDDDDGKRFQWRMRHALLYYHRSAMQNDTESALVAADLLTYHHLRMGPLLEQRLLKELDDHRDDVAGISVNLRVALRYYAIAATGTNMSTNQATRQAIKATMSLGLNYWRMWNIESVAVGEVERPAGQADAGRERSLEGMRDENGTRRFRRDSQRHEDLAHARQQLMLAASLSMELSDWWLAIGALVARFHLEVGVASVRIANLVGSVTGMHQSNESEGADVTAIGIICLGSLVFCFRKQLRHWISALPN
jgi:hypothetical protein